jgi:outer membrane protein OmpA-like peptidoglycan-associated protein
MAGFMDKVRGGRLVGAALVGLALSMMGATLGGCNSVSKDEHQALLNENEEIRQQLAQQQNAAKQTEQQLAAAQAENAGLKNQLANNTQPAGDPGPTYAPERDNRRQESRKIGSINFAPGSTMVDSKTMGSQLSSIVSALKGQYSGYDVRIEGHADGAKPTRGKYKTNEALSEARAEALKDYLMSRGISGSRISTNGLGSTTTKVSKDGRRADVLVIGAN